MCGECGWLGWGSVVCRFVVDHPRRALSFSVGRRTFSFERAYNQANAKNKDLMGGENAEGCFSLIIGQEYDSLDLVAPNPTIFAMWVVGITLLTTAAKALAVSGGSAKKAASPR